MDKTKPKQSKKVISDLFIKMQANYGGLFSGRFPTKQMMAIAVEEYRIELAPYSEALISEAYDVCKKQFLKGPTMSEFADVCKTLRRAREVPEKKGPWIKTGKGIQLAAECKKRFGSKQQSGGECAE